MVNLKDEEYKLLPDAESAQDLEDNSHNAAGSRSRLVRFLCGVLVLQSVIILALLAVQLRGDRTQCTYDSQILYCESNVYVYGSIAHMPYSSCCRCDLL